MGLRVLFIAGTTLLIFGTIRGETSLRRWYELKTSRDILGAAVAGLEKDNHNLQREITRLKNSPDYARRVLRDKYHLTEKNEKIIFFAD